jgi:LacI family transcriptional regulator
MSATARGFMCALESGEDAVRPIVLHGKFNFDGGADLAEKLLDKHPKVTAIFAANDVMAFGVVQAVMGRGLRIPEDLSLIGFDNLLEDCAPATHHHPPTEIRAGISAVEILLRLARDKPKQIPEHRRLGVELIERQSCKPPVRRQCGKGTVTFAMTRVPTSGLLIVRSRTPFAALR